MLLLLSGVALWASHELRDQSAENLIPTPLPIGSAFDGNAMLPVEEFKQRFDQGRELLRVLQGKAQRWRQIATAADWSAFIMTSVVAVVAGYFGVAAAPDEAGLAAVRAAGAEPAGEPGATTRRIQPKERRRRRILRWIGVLAAFASVLIALSAKAAAARAEIVKSAIELSDGLARNRKAWFDAKTAEEATLVLGELEKTILQAGS